MDYLNWGFTSRETRSMRETCRDIDLDDIGEIPTFAKIKEIAANTPTMSDRYLVCEEKAKYMTHVYLYINGHKIATLHIYTNMRPSEVKIRDKMHELVKKGKDIHLL